MRVVPTYFRPQFQKHRGEVCGGVELAVVVDPPTVAPFRLGVELLAALQRAAPRGFRWRRERRTSSSPTGRRSTSSPAATDFRRALDGDGDARRLGRVVGRRTRRRSATSARPILIYPEEPVKTPALVAVDERAARRSPPLFAAARERGRAASAGSISRRRRRAARGSTRAAALGALRAVAAGGGRVGRVKPLRGAPVLRDLLREHFLGCAVVLVRGVDAGFPTPRHRRGELLRLELARARARDLDAAAAIAELLRPRHRRLRARAEPESMSEPIRFFLPGPVYVLEETRRGDDCGRCVGHRSPEFRPSTSAIAASAAAALPHRARRAWSPPAARPW